MRSIRLDAMLVERGLVSSRERAKELISAGGVFVEGVLACKAARVVTEQERITVREELMNDFVGRGYRKLEKALDCFDINVFGMRCMDVGASTGGFTQLLLARGAIAVVAVDVGSGQLAKILCEDERVVNLEKTDVRTLTTEQVGEVLFVSVDVSFISLKLVLPRVYALLKEGGAAVCLIKPQFEVGPHRVGKRGVVKDQNVQAQAIEEVLGCAQTIGFMVGGLTFSPICGGEGNVEYLAYLHKNGPAEAAWDAKQVVRAAWEELKQ